MKKQYLLRVLGIITITAPLVFGMVVVSLGLFQSGYSHTVDTISVLALGEWGFIQQINFGVLAFGLAAVGLGLSFIIHKKYITPISIIFFIFAYAIILLIFFSADPVDRTKIKLTHMNTWEGFIHITLTMAIIALTAPAIMVITRGMKKSNTLKNYVIYTRYVFLFNIVFGALWFIFRRLGILFEWKGLWQKILAINVLVWMIQMGRVFIIHSRKQI